MSRVVLVLNTCVLIVTLIVALSTSDVQGDVLQTAIRTAGVSLGRRAAACDPGVGFLRVIQSLDRFLPRERLERIQPGQLRAIHEAISRYQTVVGEGTAAILGDDLTGPELRTAFQGLGMDARREVESVLATSFRDPEVVSRLATEVINSAR